MRFLFPEKKKENEKKREGKRIMSWIDWVWNTIIETSSLWNINKLLKTYFIKFYASNMQQLF